ncbi:hypothetical protein EVAR_12128_1 [Eumeta japonica]|uniref:Ecdysteroid UDP-glucosyltransferase n=1 Tax=Eumeta variegata TaxID=151549 RepID=A0A4C1U5X1_EUMVA|nr:hypothetical protein EVAR_12128_1 [Eumeta japonica]
MHVERLIKPLRIAKEDAGRSLSLRMKLSLLLSLVYASDAYRILVVFPTPGRSHSILGQGFVDTLSQAGHEVRPAVV